MTILERRDQPGGRAYVYRQDGQLTSAAKEYKRIERESQDEEVRREALLVAAELYGEAGSSMLALLFLA